MHDDFIQTLRELSKTPYYATQKPTLSEHKIRSALLSIEMEENKRENLVSYLKQDDFYYKDFGHPEDAEVLIAFSYGEGPLINKKLAQCIEYSWPKETQKEVFAQWEIAGFLKDFTALHRIEIDEGKNYITTREVTQKCLKAFMQKLPKVFLVSQAWHAPRCTSICVELGLKVVGGRFIDGFSPNDPQKWVRDPLSWLTKECENRVFSD